MAGACGRAVRVIASSRILYTNTKQIMLFTLMYINCHSHITHVGILNWCMTLRKAVLKQKAVAGKWKV